jgi:hypothetical protein
MWCWLGFHKKGPPQLLEVEGSYILWWQCLRCGGSVNDFYMMRRVNK